MFDEDLTAFLNTDEHANEIVLQSSGKIISGIIDKEYVETNEMQSYQPVLTCRTEDINTLSRGDLLEDGKTIYKFIYQEADGTGISKAVLNIVQD